MYSPEQISTAVARGIITQDQYTRLMAHLEGNDPALAEPEKFRLFQGMNDIFIFIGAIAISIAWFSFWLSLMEMTVVFLGLGAAGFAGFWLLAERVAGRMKSTLPSIVVMITLGLTLWFVVASLFGLNFQDGNDFTQGGAALAGYLALFAGQMVFFWRFRLPISFALIALSLVGVFVLSVSAAMGHAFVAEYIYAITGVTGVILLILAVAIDLRDPLRKNGWAECAFWLYVMGSPMLIHSLMSRETSESFGLVLVLFAGAMMASLILDRRSPVISMLIYVGFSFAGLVEHVQAEANVMLMTGSFAIGVIVLATGFYWQRLRALVLKVLPDGRYKDLLPPAHVS